MVSYPVLFFSPVSLLNWKRLKVQEISKSPLYYHFHLIFLCALKKSINIGNNIPERYICTSVVFQTSFYFLPDYFHILHQLLTPFSLPLLLVLVVFFLQRLPITSKLFLTYVLLPFSHL